MGKFHRSVIRSYLWLERVAMESLEGHHYSFESVLHDAENDNDNSGTELPLTNHSARHDHSQRRLSLPSFAANQRMYCPSEPLPRRIALVLVLTVIIALELVYYAIHAAYAENGTAVSVKVYLQLFSVDALALAAFLSFPFAAPLHNSLGFLDHQITPALYKSRLDQLYNDQGTCRIINIFMLTTLAYMYGDIMYFRLDFPSSPVFLSVYTIATLINICTFYGAILGVTLTMRAFLSRLCRIEEEVIMSLDGPTSSYGSLEDQAAEERPHIQALAKKWAMDLASIRNDINHLAGTFGPRMIAGIFIFVVDTTSMVAVVFEEVGEDESKTALFMRTTLFAYLANSICLIVSVSFEREAVRWLG